MTTRTREEYQGRMEAAVNAFLATPEAPNVLAVMAEIVGVSLFHFHRLFAALVGEAPGAFIRRIRLERAAAAIRAGDSVSVAALDAGYESSQALSKAFRAAYGLSPTEWRSRQLSGQISSPARIHWGSPPHLYPQMPTTMKLEIKDLPRRRLAYLEHSGPYYQIGSTFERLAQIARAGGLLPGAFENAIGMYFDDPTTVPEPELRSWAGLIVADEARLPHGLTEGWLEGGCYAVGVHMGSYETMFSSWGESYRLVSEAGLTIRQAPPFELYVNDCEGTPIEEVRTDICIPVEFSLVG